MDHSMYINKIINSAIQIPINTSSTDHDLKALREEEIIQTNNT